MNRLIPSMVVAAAMLCLPTLRAGEPGPGLEIINPDGSVNTVPAPPGPPPSTMYYPPATPPAAPPTTPYAPVQPEQPWASDPFPRHQGMTMPQTPFPAGPSAAEGAIQALNDSNRAYRGLAAAKAQGNLRGAADIIWQTLRERRIVYLSLERGPGGSRGVASPYAMQQVNEAVNPGVSGGQPQSPLAAVARIDLIVDTFEQAVLDDYSYGALMDQILVRLYTDLATVGQAMDATAEAAVYHELARAYLRASIVCDFFLFPREDLASEVNTVIANTEGMFHPDGSSVGGDVGGASGAVFHDLLLIDELAKHDRTFERSVINTWNSLETPARYILSLALPDGSLPRFGPRGGRELGPIETARLREIYESSPPPRRRAGLAATASFPGHSAAPSYGGIYASRSGTEPGARYLAVRFGPLGHLAGAPAHHDFGSLVIAGHNVTFVADPGGVGGRAADPGAHSTLSLNGQFAVPKPCTAEVGPIDAVWRTNSAIDYATDASVFADGKSWQRQVLYVKGLPGEAAGDYWLVLDRVTMNGDPRPQAARIRFRLAPGITAYHDGTGMLATSNFGNGPGLRIYPIDQGSQLVTADGEFGIEPSFSYDNAGGAISSPSVILDRTLVGDATTATLLYPVADSTRRPARIVRDQDIIRGRPGAIVVDHGLDQIDVVAWAPEGESLVTPTLNLQMSADAALFRLRRGKIVRMAFVGLEYFQAKEPDGGEWSMRVRGDPATLFFEPESRGGWRVLSDAANAVATLDNVNLGPAIGGRRFQIRPGETLIVPR
ncbi:MAG: heparinase II/III-family protein [Planctomycetota bacterium]|jgi:hypothetical protein|nr:heparinase II/III-family protein [Planctomycetota bacterium]